MPALRRQFAKWSGQCSACEAWNSLVEEVTTLRSSAAPRYQGYAIGDPELTQMADIQLEENSNRLALAYMN